MHFVAVQGLIEEARKSLAEEASKPKPIALAMYSDDALRALAVEWAQGLKRQQHADIRNREPRDYIVSIHDLLKEICGDVLAAYDREKTEGVTGLFLKDAGVPLVWGEPKFKTLVFEFAEALDRETVQPDHGV